MVKVTLTNRVHGTVTTAVVTNKRLTANQEIRVAKKLCGNKDCVCSGVDPVAYDSAGNLYFVDKSEKGLVITTEV